MEYAQNSSIYVWISLWNGETIVICSLLLIEVNYSNFSRFYYFIHKICFCDYFYVHSKYKFLWFKLLTHYHIITCTGYMISYLLQWEIRQNVGHSSLWLFGISRNQSRDRITLFWLTLETSVYFDMIYLRQLEFSFGTVWLTQDVPFSC